MLRYWEKEFRQLNPRTNSRGKRFYTRKDIDLIVEIHRLVKEERFTIDGARKILDNGGAQETRPAPQAASDAPAQQFALSESDLANVVNRLEALRAQLLALKQVAGDSTEPSERTEHSPQSLTRAW
jgi:DNA-binding transcriptional MerR regulator